MITPGRLVIAGAIILALALYTLCRVLSAKVDAAPLECPLCHRLTFTWPVCERCGQNIDTYLEGLRRQYVDIPAWRAPEPPILPTRVPLVKQNADGVSVRTIALRPEVLWFAGEMEHKLQRHDDRPGWQDEPLSYLVRRLLEEVDELSDAILLDEGVVGEAADVGNLAMMIADRWLIKHGEPVLTARHVAQEAV